MGSLSSNSAASNFHGSFLQETPYPHQDLDILEPSICSRYGFYDNLDSWPKDPNFLNQNQVPPKGHLETTDLELLESSRESKLGSWPKDPNFLKQNQVPPKGYPETTDLELLEPSSEPRLDSWGKYPSFKKKNQVFLEGYVESTSGGGGNEDELVRSKSLTDDDLDELKGCLDLGFGFSYDEIPELCNTLPALELCYSMSQKFMDEQQSCNSVSSSVETASSPASSGPIANWKISSPGDHPEDVKARLKYWAQAVACTVRLCN